MQEHCENGSGLHSQSCCSISTDVQMPFVSTLTVARVLAPQKLRDVFKCRMGRMRDFPDNWSPPASQTAATKHVAGPGLLDAGSPKASEGLCLPCDAPFTVPAFCPAPIDQARAASRWRVPLAEGHKQTLYAASAPPVCIVVSARTSQGSPHTRNICGKLPDDSRAS